jgi:hypothetical protein
MNQQRRTLKSDHEEEQSANASAVHVAGNSRGSGHFVHCGAILYFTIVFLFWDTGRSPRIPLLFAG